MRLPVCIIDDLLGPEASGALLGFALDRRAAFIASTVYEDEADGRVNPDFRASLSYDGALGEVIAPLSAAIGERIGAIAATTGVRDFEPVLRDVDLVAHCDGHRFGRHIDTATGASRAVVPMVRMLSLVYYLHRTPRRFSGGELAVYPLAGSEPQVIAPRHDRLVAFPAIAPHEVRPISLPGNAFADARFAVVGWMMRPERAARPPL